MNAFSNRPHAALLCRAFLLTVLCLLRVPLSSALEKSGTIASDETWSGAIEIPANLSIPAGVTLTIEPGTVVKLSDLRKISVAGTLVAVGTEEQPIYFTSIKDDAVGGDTNGDGAATTPAANAWSHLETVTTNAASMTLENVVVRYGGRSGYALYAVYGSASLKKVQINDCNGIGIRISSSSNGAFTLEDVSLNRIGSSASHHGIQLEGSNAKVVATGVSMTDIFGDCVVVASAQNWKSSGSSFSGTGVKAIRFDAGTISDHQSWDDQVPYYLSGRVTVASGASLTLPAGCRVLGDTTGNFYVQGQMFAYGTDASPIQMTSISDDSLWGDVNGNGNATVPAANDWQGINVENPGSAVLEHVWFRYGGRSLGGTVRAAGSLLSMTDCVIQDGSGDGITVSRGDIILENNTVQSVTEFGVNLENTFGAATLRNNHFEDAVLGPYQFRLEVQLDASGTTSTNCGKGDAINVFGTSIQESQEWKENLVYWITGTLYVDDGKVWSVAPGSRVKVAIGRGIYVRGVLKSKGTQAKPVTFTSIYDDSIGGDTNGDGDVTTAAAGDWNFITVEGTNGDASLDFTRILYAGRGSGDGTGAFVATAKFTVRDCLIENSQTTGIRIGSTKSGTITRTTISNPGSHGINVAATSFDSVADFRNNVISNPGAAAIRMWITNPVLLEGTQFLSDASMDYIELFANSASEPVTLPGNFTYVVNSYYSGLGDNIGVPTDTTLTIEAGAILKFDKFKGMQVDGTLIIKGTADNPVIFTSQLDDSAGGDTNGDGNATTPAAGDWFSLWYRDGYVGADARKAVGDIEYLIVKYAGIEGIGLGTGTPAILLDGGKLIEMRHITILDAADVGLRSRFDSVNATVSDLLIDGTAIEGLSLQGGKIDLENVTLTNIAGDALQVELDCEYTLQNLTLGSNVPNPITRVTSGVVRRPVTLGHTDVVIIDANVSVSTSSSAIDPSLTILPGTVVKMRLDAAINFTDLGTGPLVAKGTPEKPIVFTSLADDSVGGDTNGDGDTRAPAAGDWYGFRIAHPDTVFANCDIRYAVSPFRFNSFGQSPTVTTRFSGLKLRDFSAEAFFIEYVRDLVIENCLVYNYENVAIYNGFTGSGKVVVKNSTFYGGAGGVKNGSFRPLELYNNVFAGMSSSAIEITASIPIVTSRHNLYFNPEATDGNFSNGYTVGWTPGDGEGDVFADPKFVDPDSGDFDFEAGSPLIDAGDGTRATKADFRGFVRFDDAGILDTGAGSPSYTDIGAFERLGSSDPTLNPDLEVDPVSVKINLGDQQLSFSEAMRLGVVSPGQIVEVEFTVKNVGGGAALGNWMDAVYFSRDGVWDPSDIFAGSAVRPGTLGIGATYTQMFDIVIPHLINSDYRLIARTDFQSKQIEYRDGNNTATSEGSYGIEVPTLPLNATTMATFASSGPDSRLYRVNASLLAGRDLRIKVETTGASAVTQLLASLDKAPTGFTFDYGAQVFEGKPATLQFNLPRNGDLYLMLNTSDAGDGADNVSIRVDTLDFSIARVRPERAGNGGPTTLIVEGASFETGDLVVLRHSDDGDLIEPDRILLRDTGTLTVPFVFSGDKLGKYDVIVTKAESSVELSEGFELIAVAPLPPTPKPIISLSSPDFVRANPLAPTPLEVVISNPFSYEIPAMAVLQGTLNDGTSGGRYSTSASREGSSELVLLPISEVGQPGMIGPGETIRTRIYYQGIGNTNNPGGMIHQDMKTVPVDNSPATFSMMDSASFYHSEFEKRVGTTMESLHHAISEEAARLREIGIHEMDGETLLDSIYSRVTGIGDNGLSGAVLDGNGTPLSNTQIRVVDTNGDGEVYTLTTNSQGQFSLNQMPSGAYRIIADGYEPSGNPVTLYGGMTMTGHQFTLSAQPSYDPIEEATQYTDISVLYVEGVPHLFFVRRGVAMHTYYDNGAWTTARIVGPGGSPLPIYSPTLVEGDPAIAVFLERSAGRVGEDPEATVNPNDIQIMVAVATANGSGGWEWHQPVPYASHPEVAYAGFDVVLDEAGYPVVVWLAHDLANLEADTDLYFNRRLLTADDIGPMVANFGPRRPVYTPDAEDFFYFREQPEEERYFLSQGEQQQLFVTEVCRDFITAFSDDFTLLELKDNQPAILKRLFGANQISITGGYGGEANLREGKASGRVDIDLKFLYDKKTGEGVFATGQGRVNVGWKLNRDMCKYQFKDLTASGAVRVRSRVPIPNLSFKLGPVADIHVGFQIDGTFGGTFKWERVELLPTFGKFTLETGIGGYAVGTALGGTASLAGSLTGNIKLEADRNGVDIKDIFAKGTVEGKIGFWKRTHEFKYSFLNDVPSSFAGDGGFQILSDPLSYERTYTTPEGWEVLETGVREAKMGTNSDYSQVGIASSVLGNVAADFQDQSVASLARGGSGSLAGVWTRESGANIANFDNSLIFAEFSGTGWEAPVTVPNVTGYNLEARSIRDANDLLLIVFAHSDTSGLTEESTDAAAFEALEESDVWFVVNGPNGWSNPQSTSSVPGMATNVRLHQLPNGSVYLSWIEAQGMETSLYLQKWDSANRLWLARQLVSDQPITSPLAMASVSDVVTAIWAESVPSQSGADDFMGGSVLRQSRLVSGTWTVPEDLAIPFDDFYPEPAGNPSNGGIQISSSAPRPSAVDLSFFDLNNYVPVPSICCEEDPQDVPALKVPEVDVPDTRQWPTAVGSFDPNDKFGPNGHGPEGFVPGGLEFPYTVMFENDPDEGATAPALRVTVTDQLDSDFDYTTFRWVDFGWGDLRVDAPAESQNFETLVDYHNPDGSPLSVKVTATFNAQTGAIRIVFDSIDPDTGVTPSGAFDGFLQVESGDGNGEGFFNYRVAQKADLADGASFSNQANIVFDLNEPILTPETLHTIDLVKPSSSASSPDVSNSNAFVVTLSGNDGSGSGIAFYNVYRSINGGPWELWLGATTEAAPVYNGQNGNSYSFYSVATDWVGLNEDKAQSAETTTVVMAPEIRIQSVEVLDDHTLRIHALIPDALVVDLELQSSPLQMQLDWLTLEGVVVEKLVDNQYRITVSKELGEGLFFRLLTQE